MEHKLQFCLQCGRPDHDGFPCITRTQRFLWQYGGENVYLIGSWTFWQKLTKMKKTQKNPFIFQADLNLPIGIHYYKFYIDGQWKFDPNEEKILNTYNCYDNVLKVFPAAIEACEDDMENNDQATINFSLNNNLCIKVKIFNCWPCEQCFLIGSWDNWNQKIKMEKKLNKIKAQNENISYLCLEPGTYEYKFIVDGKWKHDPHKNIVEDTLGGYNNQIKINKKNSIINLTNQNKTKEFGEIDINALEWNQIQIDELNFAAIQGHSLDLIGESIFMFGGFFKNTFRDTLFTFSVNNLELSQPDTSGKIPENRAYHQSVVVGNSIIIYGGINEKKVFNDCFIFNTLNFTWREFQTVGKIPIPTERSSFTMISDELIV